MKFKNGDFLRVKPGVLLEETKEPVHTWGGTVIDRYHRQGEEVHYHIRLDSISFKEMPNEYWKFSLYEGLPPDEYIFAESELELMASRDTATERKDAQEQMIEHFNAESEAIEAELNRLEHAIFQNWLAGFKNSEEYQQLLPDARERAFDIIETFKSYVDNYFEFTLVEWDAELVEEICAGLFPEKLAAEIAYFQMVSPVLAAFFQYLEVHNLHADAASMQRTVVKLAPKIVNKAQNPKKWSVSKSFSMKALSEGVDLSDKEAFSQFISQYSERIAQRGVERQINLHLAPRNKFIHISRNSTVKVKYIDGTIKEGKFKRLEADLLAGNCELLH